MKAPDYKRIYSDMITMKFPDKIEIFDIYLAKKKLTAFDVMDLQKKLFQNKKSGVDFNQKHKSYDVFTIQKILRYQKEHQLNNVQLAAHFKLSRNTVAKWKKLFPQSLNK